MNLDTPPLRRLARRAGRAAPLLTLAVLIASPAVIARPITSADDIERLEAIKVAMESVPTRIGDWIGIDVAVPTEATEILNANALLSREYSEIGGRSIPNKVTMALIHCRDVRDMNGHWPLNCYPQSGWSIDKVVDRVDVPGPNDVTYPFAWCRFTIADGTGALRSMSVLYAFVLPDGRLETDMRSLGATSTRRRDSAKGVAQFQFVFYADVPAESCARVAHELMLGMPAALLRRLGVRTPHDGDMDVLSREQR
ncbi:MAG: exosortase-associated EpsI family protein [Phycisphaerae bacterium]|nr:exosortase-associated EpsI family protein [Phycisphaerae bacterium]